MEAIDVFAIVGSVIVFIVIVVVKLRGRPAGATALPDNDHETLPEGTTWSDVAMTKLWPLPRVIPGPWCHDQAEIDAAMARCSELRSWVDRTDMPRALRREYLSWLRFCENDNKEAAKEVRTGQRKRELEAFSQERAKRHKATHEAASKYPGPPTR